MGLFGPEYVRCPRGVWTTLIWNFGTGFPQTYVVTLAVQRQDGSADHDAIPRDDATAYRDAPIVGGDYVERRALWIFPTPLTEGRLSSRMTFTRNWINAYYTVRIRPDVSCIAKVD